MENNTYTICIGHTVYFIKLTNLFMLLPSHNILSSPESKILVRLFSLNLLSVVFIDVEFVVIVKFSMSSSQEPLGKLHTNLQEALQSRKEIFGFFI